MEGLGVAAAALVAASGTLAAFATATSQGMTTKDAPLKPPPENTAESKDLWAKVNAAIQKRQAAMTESDRAAAGNELEAARKAYNDYIEKTKTAAVPLTPASEVAAESKGPTASQALAAVPLTPASEAVLKAAEERGPTSSQVDVASAKKADVVATIVDEAIAAAEKAAKDGAANRARLEARKTRIAQHEYGGKRKKKGTRRRMHGGDRLLDALESLGEGSPSPRPAFMKLITVTDDQVALELIPTFNTFISWEQSINGRRLFPRMLKGTEDFQKKFADALFRDVPTAWPTINPVFKKRDPISNYVRAAEALAAVAANRPRELTAEEAAVVDSETAKQREFNLNASLSNTFLAPAPDAPRTFSQMIEEEKSIPPPPAPRPSSWPTPAPTPPPPAPVSSPVDVSNARFAERIAEAERAEPPSLLDKSAAPAAAALPAAAAPAAAAAAPLPAAAVLAPLPAAAAPVQAPAAVAAPLPAAAVLAPAAPAAVAAPLPAAVAAPLPAPEAVAAPAPVAAPAVAGPSAAMIRGFNLVPEKVAAAEEKQRTAVAAAAAESNEAVKDAYIAAGEAWRKLGANTDTTQDAALAEAARVAQDAAEKVKASAALAAAPVAPLPAPVEADAAQNMFGGECEVPVQGPSYAATKIRGDGWCFYKAVLAGYGKPGYTEAEENVSIEARKQSDDGAYALATQLRDLLVGPNLELFKTIYGSPRTTTIVDDSGLRRETLNADQFIARMVQEPIAVEGFLAPRVYAEGDALAPFVANLLHVRIAIYAGGQLSGKGCPDNEPNAPVVSLDYVNGDHYNVFLPLPTPSVPAAEEPAEAEPAASESRRPSSAASVASEPSSAESESRRPSSATSLGSVGVPQLRDQDFAVRLGAAKAKFEQMRAATGKLEMTVDASKVVRKPTRRRNQTQRINPADIDNLYRELKASQLTRKAKTDNERNKRAQRRLTASVAPAPPDDELAAIEADLKSAEETVGQFKALVDELRAKDSGVSEVADWIMTADMELELQLDYLSQVEQNLAAVPSPVDLAHLREVHAGLGLPRPPASPAKPPWRNGGRRKTPRRRQGRHKRPPRNSTFRRHRKH